MSPPNQDKTDALDMLRYFWNDKGDMSRWVQYEEWINEFPLLKQAAINIDLATLALDGAFDEEERRIERA